VQTGLTEVVAALVTDGQRVKAVQSRPSAPDHPPVPIQPPTAADASVGDPAFDAALSQAGAAVKRILGLTGVELLGQSPRPAQAAANERDGVRQGFEHRTVLSGRSAATRLRSKQRFPHRPQCRIRDRFRHQQPCCSGRVASGVSSGTPGRIGDAPGIVSESFHGGKWRGMPTSQGMDRLPSRASIREFHHPVFPSVI
jgi:hypothetical protein